VSERSLAGHTVVMAAGTAVSRVLGFVRTIMLTTAIGMTGAAANAFDMANRFPDFFYAVIAGGVLNAILVPQIVKAYQRRNGEVFVNKLLSMGIVVLAIVTAMLTASATLLIAIYTRDWTAGQRALSVAFAYWCIPQLFFYGLYTLLGQLLNARGSFGPYMWAPVLNNVVTIAGFGAFVALYGREVGQGVTHPVGSWTGAQIALLAGCTLAGVAAQALVLIFPLRRLGFHFHFTLNWRGAGLGSAARVALWTLGALVLDQVATAFAYNTASYAPAAAAALGEVGAVAGNAVFTNALTVYVIPHSLITVSLTTALFTSMSQAAAAGDVPAVRRTLSFGIRTTSAFTLFATVALIVLALPLCRVLYLTRTFEEVDATARALVPLALGLVPLGITLLIKRVFFAFEDGRTVFTFQIPMSLLFVGGCLLTQKIMDPSWWVVGIGLSQSLAYVAGVVLRLQTLRYRLGGVEGRRLVWMHARAGVAAVIAGELGWLALRLFGDYGHSVPMAALALVTVGCGMAVVYLALLHLMGVRELSTFLAPLVRKLRRR
jgi:putative peptidoglycan lipid II flippase